MNIQNDNCLRVVLADGVIDIPQGSKVTINENGKTYIDGMPLEEYAKNRKKMNSIDLFSSLPHLMKVDGEICEYDDSSTPEYIANLSEYDGEWHIDWVSEEGDSIQNIYDKDISVAISQAYEWCVNEGFIRDFNTPMTRLKRKKKLSI